MKIVRVSLFCCLIAGSMPACAAPTSPEIAGRSVVQGSEGPELRILPGETTILRVRSSNAKRFEWLLDGAGTVSPTVGPAVHFTAPDSEGTSLLRVRAFGRGKNYKETALDIQVSAAKVARLNSLAISAGWMAGDDEPAEHINHETIKNCRTDAPCERFEYQSGGQWAGVMWWPHGCGDRGSAVNWQRVTNGACALDLPKQAVMREVRRLTFWARGETGDEIIEFKVGASNAVPSPARSLGKVELNAEWTKYAIDLADVDLRRTTSAFTWVASDLDNPNGAIFYLDSVQFEGAR